MVSMFRFPNYFQLLNDYLGSLFEIADDHALFIFWMVPKKIVGGLMLK